MTHYALGLDIGGTAVKTGLFEVPSGKLLKHWEIPTRREENGRFILPDAAAKAAAVLEDQNINPDQILGAGLGIPGPVLEERNVNRGTNLGWGVFDVCAAFRDLTGIRNVKAGNDANCAALGEVWQGAARSFRSAVMVTVGTGIGAGIVQDGRILTGSHGGAGEIGHLHVRDGEPEACGCGNHGCLEQYASATGIVRLARRYGASEGLTAKDVFDRAKAGDPPCLASAEEAARLLGQALAAVSCTLDPEILLLGGGVSRAGDFLLTRVRDSYQRYAFHTAKETEIRIASLGNMAGIYGAAKMVL